MPFIRGFRGGFTAWFKTIDCYHGKSEPHCIDQCPNLTVSYVFVAKFTFAKTLDHFALRPQKRGGLLGTGTGGKGTKEWRLHRGHRPRKTGETVDRRQNNGSVKVVSPHHCPATSALRNCCFNCRAWAESQGQCPLHCCSGTTRSERSPTFSAQLHLPTHDRFWANLKVQLHLPPLDLLIFWSRLEPWQNHK